VAKSKGLFEAIRELLEKNTDTETMESLLWKRFGKRLAVLALDSSGFTRIIKDRGAVHYLSCLVRVREVLRPVFERHGCVSFRPEADNILAEFRSPKDALEAALEANRTLRAAKIMLTESEPFRICIGIGYGDVLCSQSEGVFGDQMNLASKLGEDIAKGGEILLTEAAYSELSPRHKERFEKRRRKISGVSLTYYLTKCKL